ncbi:MAG: hypothetical protein JWO62_2281 [Acidimicrobiaceae bacterium]|nr:hypothetical protein [Acidimicrobiaceae bacterium]
MVAATTLVKTARTLAGLSRSQLAALAGVPASTVTRIEAGSVDPTTGMLDRILMAAGYQLDSSLMVLSDPAAVAAARSVLDPASGLADFPGVGAWLDRWRNAKLVVRDPETGALVARSERELARRAGLSARLSSRPGAQSYQRMTNCAATANRLRSLGVNWPLPAASQPTALSPALTLLGRSSTSTTRTPLRRRWTWFRKLIAAGRSH